MIERALKKAKKVIVVDPRRTKPARDATHWLQIRPGTDGALALAMIHVIITEELIDQDFVHHYTVGYEQLAEHIKPFTPEWAAPITRISPEEIRAAARTYATSSPACMLWGSATDASASNFQTARSLLILRALTGNIDCPGGDVLWVPPKGVHQKSLFMSDEQEGAQFLPPEKMNRAVIVWQISIGESRPSADFLAIRRHRGPLSSPGHVDSRMQPAVVPDAPPGHRKGLAGPP